MIIDLNEFDKLKKFILFEPFDSKSYLTKQCRECNLDENTKCEYKEICLKYCPISEEYNDYNLIVDLFDTIEFIMKGKEK